MTSTDVPSGTRDHRRLLRLDPATSAGAGVALACTLVGQFVGTPWDTTSGGWDVDVAGGGGWAGLALLLGFVLVELVVVSAIVNAARAAEPGAAVRRAVWLAVAGAASLLVFWTGLPSVLAAGAAGLAVHARTRSARISPVATVALVLAVLTLAAALYLAFTG